MIHAAGPRDLDLMPSQWQRAKTLTQIQLHPPGDGQMDMATVYQLPQVSIIEPQTPPQKKKKKKTRETLMIQCQNAKWCIAAFMYVFPHPEEQEVVILFTATQL